MRRSDGISALSLLQLSGRVADRAYALVLKRAFAEWGDGSVIRRPFRVSGERRIALGAEVCVGEGSWFQSIDDGVIRIGNGCQFSGYAVISAACEVVLESDVLLARNVHILDHLHRFDDIDVPVHAQGITGEAPVRIKANAWIGANAVILPGVTIGRGAVIGANSIVLSDVPAASVAVGAPARVVSGLGERPGRVSSGAG